MLMDILGVVLGVTLVAALVYFLIFKIGPLIIRLILGALKWTLKLLPTSAAIIAWLSGNIVIGIVVTIVAIAIYITYFRIKARW